MAYSQHVVTCEEAVALGLAEQAHEDCTVIFCRDDDRDWVAWVSHDDAENEADWQDRKNPDLDTTDWVSPGTPSVCDEMRVYDFAEVSE